MSGIMGGQEHFEATLVLVMLSTESPQPLAPKAQFLHELEPTTRAVSSM